MSVPATSDDAAPATDGTSPDGAPNAAPAAPGDVTPRARRAALRRTARGVADRLVTAGAASATSARAASRAAALRWGGLVGWLERLAPDENVLLLTFAVAVGLAAAGGVVAFYGAIDLAYDLFYRWTARVLPGASVVLYRPLLTGAAFAVAWAVWRATGRGPDGRVGDGLTVPDVQLAVVRRGGRIPARAALGRTLASAVTLGGGGSAGSEGPVAVLGAAAGSSLGRLFRFSAERTTVLVGAGAAAAIAAAFNAPLAGAFFALEEILGSFRATTFSPVVVASVVGAVVSRAVFGNHPAFPIPRAYGYAAVTEVALFFPLLGAACGVASAAFVRVHFGVGALAARLTAGRPARAAALPWAAGALVGAVVLASGGRLVGAGHLAIPLAAFGRMAWWALVLLAFGKVVVTALTLQGGGSGGLFTPSLFVGAATGGAVGVALRALVPAVPITPEAYAVVGMGALVAGATGAPITGILLVFEMTNDYALMIPLMVAVVVCHVVRRRLEPDTLYSGWLRRRGEHLEHGADRDVLAGLTVADAYERDVLVVAEGDAVHRLFAHLGHRDQGVFPVVDDDGRLVGVLTAADLGAVARADRALDAVLLAADLAQPTETLAPGDSLRDAVRRMGVRGVSALPVVEPGTGRLLGVIHRGGVLARYERAVAASDPEAAGLPPARAAA